VCSLGLTIGLMGLDETNLHVLMASGSPRERIHAETVFKLLSRGKHWVLGKIELAHSPFFRLLRGLGIREQRSRRGKEKRGPALAVYWLEGTSFVV